MIDDSCRHQLEKWVNGVSEHNHERDECCPDFSCCQTTYLAPEAERRLFLERPELRLGLMMGFLGAALGGAGVGAHVAGSALGSG